MTSPQSIPPLALTGEQFNIDSQAGRLSYYRATPAEGTNQTPLLLVHSINAAGSAYEVKPLFEHYRSQRPVYALELPGFGFSERSARTYTPRLMTDAVLAMVALIQNQHGSAPIDSLALSLGSEFLARAAREQPNIFRSIALISPTGFDRNAPYDGPPGSTRGSTVLYRFFTFPLWRKGFFALLTSRPSIRFFLKKTWGSGNIDQAMVDYDYQISHQPGAHHAPYYFVSGFLFSKDISRVYESLQQPVWMAHGVRGDFVDYRYKSALENRPNWHFSVFQTGALPHFEKTNEFIEAYDAFLQDADQNDPLV